MALTVEDVEKIADLLEKNNEKLATKEDLEALRTELKDEIVEIKGDIGGVKGDILELRNAIIILDKRVKGLKENTVKYSDIADLFESFEEKIKKDLLVLIMHNKKEIQVIKAYLDPP